MCGGDLRIEEGTTVAECEYCGTKQTVPNADNEKKIKLFERANRLRAACEFDKAAGVYESIVADFDTEAEAYWGLILCKFGIEYVDDPATGDKVPTCHRSSFDSVLEDPNFELVMENSDAISRKVYRDEAKAIEELRRFLEDREWEEADKYCEKVLDQDPENAQAYLGKLMAELQVMNRKELVDCAEPFDVRDNYNKVLLFGDEALEKEMRGYITHINERKDEERRIAAQKAAEKRKRILSIAIPAIIAVFAIILVVTKIIIPGAEQRSEYNAAVELMNSGKYQDAIVAFEEMNGYKDSAKKIDECEYKIADSLYQKALSFYENGEYKNAAIAFVGVGDHKDARERSAALWNDFVERQTIACGDYHTVGLKSDGALLSIYAACCTYPQHTLTQKRLPGGQHGSCGFYGGVSLWVRVFGLRGRCRRSG